MIISFLAYFLASHYLCFSNLTDPRVMSWTVKGLSIFSKLNLFVITAFLPSANGLLGVGTCICWKLREASLYLCLIALPVKMFSSLLLKSTWLRLFSPLPLYTMRYNCFASFTIEIDVTRFLAVCAIFVNWGGALSFGSPKFICFCPTKIVLI